MPVCFTCGHGIRRTLFRNRWVHWHSGSKWCYRTGDFQAQPWPNIARSRDSFG